MGFSKLCQLVAIYTVYLGVIGDKVKIIAVPALLFLRRVELEINGGDGHGRIKRVGPKA